MSTATTSSTEKQERLNAATYTVAQLAVLLTCSERHIHRLRDQKKIPGELRIGRSVRFGRVIIDRWIAGGSNTTR